MAETRKFEQRVGNVQPGQTMQINRGYDARMVEVVEVSVQENGDVAVTVADWFFQKNVQHRFASWQTVNVEVAI